MSEDEARLQARIAALSGMSNQPSVWRAINNMVVAGRINQRKQASSAPYSPGYGGGYHAPPTPRWAPYSPYGQAQPSYHRGGGFHNPSYRNKSLVVNNSNAASPSGGESSAATPEASGWVKKRDRGHMQLINTSVYDQKMQQKQLDMEDTAKEKQRLRNEKEKSRVMKHVSTNMSTTTPNTPRDIVINDLRFRVAADGSKLIRVFGESSNQTDHVTGQLLNSTDGSNKDAQTTPKQTKVAGVTFHRSKNGNLYRAGLVKKSHRYPDPSKTRKCPVRSLTDLYSKQIPSRSATLCPKFTSTGTHLSKHTPAGPRLTGLSETKLILGCR